MSEQLEAILRRHKGNAAAEDLVFASQAGTPINPSNLRRRVWGPVLKKAGLAHMRIHDLRHTFASLLIQQGANIAYVKEQLGHYSVRVTVDVYGHLIPGGMREEVNRLDDRKEYPAVGSNV